MIFSIIVILIVAIIAFFHYLQGFFSSTISAICAIIAAACAVSYHEVIVESFLGGKFGNVAHGMALAVMFAVIYLILRVLFDKMVPGNLRVPAIVDKVGGAAMGAVAGIFAAGIVALVAQELPFAPSIAGYSRYAVRDAEVTLPAVGRARSANSAVTDELKGEKAGRFEESDRAKLLIPADDIVVNTVDHLSDNGSLAGRPLGLAHPDWIAELFGQRLGIETGGAKRVAGADAVNLDKVELFQVPAASLKVKDHEYKELRERALDPSQAKVGPNQILLIVRVPFQRPGGDDDGYVRFSPASARLVARKPGGAEGEMANYYPVGTVDKAQTLMLSKPDDFLFVEVRGADRGVDLAYILDRNAIVAGGGGAASANPAATLKVAEGVFFEFKRMARKDLADEKIRPASAYKASENILVLRKEVPEGQAPETPAAPETPPATATPTGTPAPAGGDVEELKQRLAGTWAGTSDAGQQQIEFLADGTLKYTNTPKTGVPNVGQGTWQAVRAAGANALVIKRKIGTSEAEATVTFVDNDNITLASANTPTPVKLQRRG
jgi:uncharacterized membrane protein required for colicin V production